jgi:aconitate hydratase 2/2-methylisocitrate dehydratase
MLDSYFKHAAERQALGIPPLPLNPEDTAEVCRFLETLPPGEGGRFLDLLKDRVSPGVDPAAKVKAAWLAEIARGTKTSPVLSSRDAIFLLGTMIGGYNVGSLVDFLEVPALAEDAVEALKTTILVYGAFDRVARLAESNAAARAVLTSWAEGEWFLRKPEFPDSLTLTVYKVDGEINTDDFSPAKQAATRPDIPLHAQAMGGTRFPDGNRTIAGFRAEGRRVVFVGDVVGTGSSRNPPAIRSCGISARIFPSFPISVEAESSSAGWSPRSSSTPPRIPAVCRSKRSM